MCKYPDNLMAKRGDVGGQEMRYYVPWPLALDQELLAKLRRHVLIANIRSEKKPANLLVITRRVIGSWQKVECRVLQPLARRYATKHQITVKFRGVDGGQVLILPQPQ